MTFNPNKYALDASAHRDMFNVRVDGKDEGPGPAHYQTIKDAFKAAGVWIWLFAEAKERSNGRRRHRSGKGLRREWDTTIFKSGGRYGFTTPEEQAYAHAWGHKNHGFFRQRQMLTNASAVGYLHSHPRGGAAAFEKAGNVFSGIEEDLDTGKMVGDLAYAVMFPKLWVGLLKPKGGVVRVRLRAAIAAEFTRRGLTTGTEMQYATVRPILAKYRGHNLFQRTHDVPDQGRGWEPGSAEWREKRLRLIETEFM